jgi:hypothetical protein
MSVRPKRRPFFLYPIVVSLSTPRLDSISIMPKRFICLLFTFCLLVRDDLLPAVVAQKGITQTIATLSEARSTLAAISSGGLFFFAGGFNGTGASARVDIYNVTNGIWTTATLSVARSVLAATSSGSLIFFAGGADSLNFSMQTKTFSGNASNQVDVYNISDGSWNTATLSQVRYGLAATSVRNLVLFGGGYYPYWPSDVVDIYDVSRNTWTNTTLSEAREYLAATSVANHYALFAGGCCDKNGNPFNVVDIFDSLSGIWNTTTLSQTREFLTAASLDNLAFFGGGDIGGYSGYPSQTFKAVDIFNATTQTWSTATLSQNRTYLAAASIEDSVAFGGGYNGANFAAVVDMFNTTSNIWFTANLSQPRLLLAATSLTNKIFFGGGQNSKSGYSNIVDIFCLNGSDCPPPPAPSPLTTPAVSSTTTNGVPSTLPSTSSAVFGPAQSATFSPQHSNTSTETTPSVNSALIGGLIGGLVGVLLVVGGIVVLVILLRKKRKKSTSDRSIEALPMEEQTKTLPTNQQGVHESEIQSQTANTASHYIPIAKSTAQSQTSQSTQNVELSAKHRIPFEDIEIQKEIGKGSYGEVCLGRWNGTAIALKFCKEKEGLEDFWKEANLMM